MMPPPNPLTTRAPAKINLSLHVLGRRPDGLHDLESLVAFAGAGDILRFEPGGPLRLSVSGPTAPLAGPDIDNLVLKAARALADRVPDLALGAFHLVKRLPVAAGIGGGSSDAAAALRLLARHNGLAPDDPRLFEAARATGADVPVCLDPRARMMRGVGERLGAAVRLAPLPVVLVNAGIALETRHVFAGLALRPGEAVERPAHPGLAPDAGRSVLLEVLHATRNDMEGAARALAPAVGLGLELLAGTAGARLCRMSGSGATCFAIYDDCRSAARAAETLRLIQPGWWIKPTMVR